MLRSFILLALVLCATLRWPSAASAPSASAAPGARKLYASVYYLGGSITYDYSYNPIYGAAYGYLSDETNVNGFAKLNITAQCPTAIYGCTPDIAFYAAGYAEGLLTADLIWNHWRNEYFGWGYNATNYSLPEPMNVWISANLDYALHASEEKKDSDPFWQEVYQTMQQLAGLTDGYNARQSEGGSDMQQLSLPQMYALNAAGDMEDLVQVITGQLTRTGAMKQSLMQTAKKRTTAEAEEMAEPLTDCSALIKLTPNNNDLYFGHTTWRSFGIIDKMYKWYTFDLYNDGPYQVSFSSSPGFLSSKDDFYLSNSGLAIMETTNNVFNRTLYSLLSTSTLLCWVRSSVASRIATTGKEWVDIFARENSGTYNNQWMVIDYKLFSPGKPLVPNTLWILEQIPGYTQIADVTSILQEQSYWASYNIPYFPEIYNISGYPAVNASYGPGYDYYKNPRAKIFAREQAKVGNSGDIVSEFGRILQFNQWNNDPFSGGDPANSISSRYDLRPSTNPSKLWGAAHAFGGTDSKITNSALIKSDLSAIGICGPTHQNLTPFSWSGWHGPAVSHYGQPDVFNFDWTPLSYQMM